MDKKRISKLIKEDDKVRPPNRFVMLFFNEEECLCNQSFDNIKTFAYETTNCIVKIKCFHHKTINGIKASNFLRKF